MSPALYAFLVSSGPVGVSRAAVARWAVRHGRAEATVLRALERAARRGVLTQRLRVRSGAVLSVVYVIPRPEARAS